MPNTGSDYGCDELFNTLGGLVFTSIVLTVLSGFIALGIFLYFARRGQFDNIEDVKFQVLREGKKPKQWEDDDD